MNQQTGTNVVFTNGDTDPWSALGYYNPRDESVVSHLIKGSTHGWDLQYSFDGESEELKYAKRLTDENIEKWLGLKEEKTTTMEETTTRGTKEKVKKGSSANFVTGLFVVLACLVRFL
uniref:Peptidase_S9 domain-containing protein n=1 Tax=Caenorhabditis tropicalis TaxID=1561998 RepID=A0A1I7UIF2_9PELO